MEQTVILYGFNDASAVVTVLCIEDAIALIVQIVSGDESLTVLYKDRGSDQKRRIVFDPFGKHRLADFADGVYLVHPSRIEEWASYEIRHPELHDNYTKTWIRAKAGLNDEFLDQKENGPDSREDKEKK